MVVGKGLLRRWIWTSSEFHLATSVGMTGKRSLKGLGSFHACMYVCINGIDSEALLLRCIGDHGREARFPFLDEDVVAYLQHLRIDQKARACTYHCMHWSVSVRGDMPRGVLHSKSKASATVFIINMWAETTCADVC